VSSVRSHAVALCLLVFVLFSLVAAAPAAAACANCLAQISLPSGQVSATVAPDGVNAFFAVTLSGVGSGYFIGDGVYKA
jgi:predicted S18 family serine protease